MYKLLDWINIDELDWDWLSINPNAIHLLEKNMDKINWEEISRNPNAIHLIEKNKDKIDWIILSRNPAIFELDYNGMKNHYNIYKEELIKKVMHPDRILKYLEQGYDIEDL